MLPNLDVTTTANSTSLCLLADAKTELGITDSSADAKLTRLIIGASRFVRNLLGREPWLQTYSEKRAGDGGVYLYLSRWPLKGDPSSVTLGTGSSPATVDASDYSVAGIRRDRLYKAGSWRETAVNEASITPGSRALEYTIAYSAGWIMPDELTEWPASTAVSLNAWYKATDADYPLIFQVTTAGTTDSTEPTWPTVDEGTVVDNTATWTAYDLRLPRDLEEAALMLVLDWYAGGLTVPAGVAEERFESMSIRYMAEQRAISGAVNSLVGAYK